MNEAETIETETTEEHAENPDAVLRKNRELLSDLAKLRDRNLALEAVARTLGDEAVADPGAFLTRRAEATQAAEHRARVVKEAALKALATEQRILKIDLEEALAAILADKETTVGADGAVSFGRTLERLAPKRPSPMPWSNPVRGWDEATGVYRSASDGPAPKTYEELQARGTAAVQLFATQSPETYQTLKADFDRRLAKPERRG